jgi:hypothetical protein
MCSKAPYSGAATIVGGFAVLAVAFETPFVALADGGLAYWMFTPEAGAC